MAVNIPVEKINDFLGSRIQRDQDEARAKMLRERLGNDDEAWGGPEFSNGLDTSTAQARAAAQKMKDFLASQGTDPDRPLRFNCRIGNRALILEVRPPQDPSAKWECTMPCEIEPGVWEWRTLQASGYDELIGRINRQLAAPPLVRDLTVEESLELARMCANKKNLQEVLARYIELRTGKPLDESVLHDPRLVAVTNDACCFTFFNSTPSATDSKDFRAFLKSHAAGRPYTVVLVRAAYEEYKTREKSAEKLRLKGLTPEGEPLPEHVGEAELQNATDKEIAASLGRIRRAFGEAERHRRDLIHVQPRTAEQAIHDLRGPSDYGEEL